MGVMACHTQLVSIDQVEAEPLFSSSAIEEEKDPSVCLCFCHSLSFSLFPFVSLRPPPPPLPLSLSLKEERRAYREVGQYNKLLLIIISETWILIPMSIMWIYVMSRVRPAGLLAVLRGKNINSRNYSQTFQPMFFVPSILIDSDYCYTTSSQQQRGQSQGVQFV